MVEKKNSQKIIVQQLSQDLEDLGKYLKDLWQFLPLPILYANPLFVILDVNSAMENLFSLKAMELIGEKVEILFEEKSTIKRILEELSREKRIENKEVEIVSKKEERRSTFQPVAVKTPKKTLSAIIFPFSILLL